MLSDKVCIVAGGGHGLGEAAAVELADRGASVVVNDLGTSLHGEGESAEPAEATVQTIRERGGEALAHFGDISSLEYTEQLVADTVAEYGRIDGAVNFAGITRDGLSYKMDGDQWDDVIRVHLRGHFALLRNLAAHWRTVARDTDDWLDPQRSFVCISSGAAFGNVGQLNYAAAKAGILGLMRTASRELSRYNIRVNALLPAAYTRMIEDMPEGVRPDESDMPAPEEIAPMVTFLLSDHATDITGRTIRTAGERIARVSDPQIARLAYRTDGWTAEELADKFQEAIGAEEGRIRFKQEESG